MEKYIIDKNEFQLYYFMLCSSDSSVVKEGAQKFSDAFAAGRHILNSDKKNFCGVLKKLLKEEIHRDIHKWIYKCTCFYNDDEIEDICKYNFFITEDKETRTWIISTIASRYRNEDDFNNVITQMRCVAADAGLLESLDEKNIFYASSLFSGFPVKLPSEKMGDLILRRNDQNGMFWMAKLFAYSDLARKKDLNQSIRPEELDLLTLQTNAEIQTYAYWGLVHRKGGTLSENGENRKHNIKSKESMKWYYAGVITGEFLNGNYDYIEDILENAGNRFADNIRAKDGILKGLLSIPYIPRFDKYILDWYFEESTRKCRMKLLEYMVKNVNGNSRYEVSYNGFGSFFTVLQDESEGDENSGYIISLVNTYKTLLYEKVKGGMVLKMSKEVDQVHNVISGGLFTGQVILENRGQVVQEVTKLEFSEKEFLKMLVEFESNCDDEVMKVESQQIRNDLLEHKLNWKEKVRKFGGDLANFITLASATPYIIDLGRKIIEMVAKI